MLGKLDSNENPCKLCKRKCCVNILNEQDITPRIPPSQDIINQNTSNFLARYPNFEVTGHDVVQTSPPTIIPRFSCTKFDSQTGDCVDYANRYDICHQAGVNYPPTENCILWKRIQPQKSIFKKLFS